jgi:hypothetical protein
MHCRLLLASAGLTAAIAGACSSGTAPRYSVAGTWTVYPRNETLGTPGLFLRETGSQVEGEWDHSWPFIANGSGNGSPVCGSNAGGHVALTTQASSYLLFRGTFRNATTVDGVVTVYGRSSAATMVKQSDSLILPVTFPTC